MIARSRGGCSNVQWSYFDVGRGYCDRCIINGELLLQRKGLDPGLYARGMGVNYNELRNANPSCFPEAIPNIVHKRAKDLRVRVLESSSREAGGEEVPNVSSRLE